MEIRTYHCDWSNEYVAHVVDYEGAGPQGWGGTPHEALADLVDELTATDDPALPDAIKALKGTPA